jgi:hypothetical protein
MPLFKTAFAIFAVIFLYNIVDASVQLYIKGPIYACSEVNKLDPIEVQKICSRAWRRK